MHHAGAEAGQLQHFVVADAADAAGLGHDARIGRIDAIHVGVNLAGIGPQHGGQGHGRRVAAAAAERRDVEIVVDALKAGGDDDVAVVERLSQPRRLDRLDAGLAIAGVGLHADLRPGQADRLVPQRMNGNRHQGHAHLLARREQHVHLAGRRLIGDLRRQLQQIIGRVAHRADDHHHLVALLLRANRPPGRPQDFFGIGDATSRRIFER